ncbi:sulfur carrier protein ThiS [Pseudobacteroides cellulosolvens]|uniref:Thiamine biosynthesis protein ThiS n=1 Tax=Pseudobacteroides cellulosolvens ATCC 35603 = DSM 2933 TaxID=398512 RepID=A0A0L6JX13_9FIRM|nr:sulfur carrier protein ThiS [Pseudobacteroides cellulosolvens]KNY29982.1 thiamine biosynthesis protein ThiS [Pseudobacteroides cellulosolvens ATCC 35603 = DSM 2933]
MYTVTVNGKKVELEKILSIKDYLESAGVDPKIVVVEYNFEIPDKSKWNEITLKDGDNLEIVKFIGGG